MNFPDLETCKVIGAEFPDSEHIYVLRTRNRICTKPVVIPKGQRVFGDDLVGPALTLDDLHKVFEWMQDSRILELKQGYNEVSDCKSWDLWVFSKENIDFPRTKNHAQDWTAILIWLLENGHVTAEQVNDILKEG
jgi:hypothetical protein